MVTTGLFLCESVLVLLISFVYLFFRFHIKVISYIFVFLWLTDFTQHNTSRVIQVAQMAEFHSSLQVSNILLYMYIPHLLLFPWMCNSERLLYETNTVSIQERTLFLGPSSEERGFSLTQVRNGLINYHYRTLAVLPAKRACKSQSRVSEQSAPTFRGCREFGERAVFSESLRSHVPHSEAKKEKSLQIPAFCREKKHLPQILRPTSKTKMVLHSSPRMLCPPLCWGQRKNQDCAQGVFMYHRQSFHPLPALLLFKQTRCRRQSKLVLNVQRPEVMAQSIFSWDTQPKQAEQVSSTKKTVW